MGKEYKYNPYDDITRKKSSNITIIDKLVIGLGIVVVGSFGLKSCAKLSSNRDIIDTEKNFNIAIDDNEHTISITRIDSYTDYSGSMIQFKTEDGLIILSSAKDTQLIREDSVEDVYNYAKALANNDESKIYNYDELQGMTFTLDDEFTKNYIDLEYNFDHALIENENGITIVELSSWKDWEDDDKIQITTTDGTVILKEMDCIKLINSSNADEDSIYNYALSLVGDENKINYLTQEKTKVYKNNNY